MDVVNELWRRGESPASIRFVAIMYFLLHAGILFALAVYGRRINARYDTLKLRGFDGRKVFDVAAWISIIGLGFSFFFVVQGAQNESEWSKLLMNYVITFPLLYLMLSTHTMLRFFYWRRRNPGSHPMDGVMLRLLTVAYWIEWCKQRRRWASRKNLVTIIMELELIAKDAERFSVRMTPWRDGETRREMRQTGMQFAHIIRSHKTLLAKAMGPDDLSPIVRSLGSILAAWGRGDVFAILHSSPKVTFRGWLRPVLQRVWPVLVLTIAAIVLPKLSIFENSPQSALSVRVTLLVAAVLAAFSRGVAAPEQISAVLGKALPFNRKEA